MRIVTEKEREREREREKQTRIIKSDKRKYVAKYRYKFVHHLLKKQKNKTFFIFKYYLCKLRMKLFSYIS